MLLHRFITTGSLFVDGGEIKQVVIEEMAKGGKVDGGIDEGVAKGWTDAELMANGGGVKSDSFILKSIQKVEGVIDAIRPEIEGGGIGWIASGETVRNREGMDEKVDSLEDIARYADVSLSDGVWTYDPIDDGAEIQYLIHTGYTKKGNLVFNKYYIIVEWADEFKFDEDGDKVDTFGIDLLEEDCKETNSRNGLGASYTETNHHMYAYENRFIEDEADKIYANGGGLKQTGDSNKAYDKLEKAKRVGYRFTDKKAKQLHKGENAKPNEEQIEKYKKGKGVYYENRKNRSDKSRTKKLEEGGEVEIKKKGGDLHN